MTEPKFDVFLCHNSEDKAAVIEIAEQLRRRGLKPWLDVWELQPGAIWQVALEQQIGSIGAVAVFVGQKGMGPWQSEEVYAFLQEFISRKCPAIPVTLPETQTQPPLPLFLKNRHWIDFRLQEPDPISQLIWGVTGEKPSEEPLDVAETVLVQKAEQFSQTAELTSASKYADLERYLKFCQWEEADSETRRLMITETGQQRLDVEALRNFPCVSLLTIDGLWTKYSNGKFGFSAQNGMYTEACRCRSHPDYQYNSKTWDALCKMNGWDGSIQFKTTSPRGHLPVFGLLNPGACAGFRLGDLHVSKVKLLYFLFFRLQTCKL